MHVLTSIHRWLRPDGVLLDLHPEPEQPVVEVVVGDRRCYLGRIDNTSLQSNIHRARATLRLLVHDRWFAAERSVVFDFMSHFPSVDSWVRHREERRATSIVAPAIIARARELLTAQPTGEIVTSEHMLATRFVRIARQV